MQQAHIFISGFVQGVGFRQFIKRLAGEKQIAGWARNTQDGRVEAVFQGREQDIDQLIQHLRKGPMLAGVKHIVIEWEEAKNQLQSFEVVNNS